MNQNGFGITCKQRELIERRMDIESYLSMVCKLMAKYGIDSSLSEIRAKLEKEILNINHSLINDEQNDKRTITQNTLHIRVKP
jgi:hypothetical protein